MRKVNQNRDAPAYLEYAAAMMGRFDYRRLTLEERGLLYTLRLECWVNQNLPIDPTDLARILGIPAEAITRLLPKLIGPFFTAEGCDLQCPEIEGYRLKIQDHRNKQSEGGKKARANERSKREMRADISSMSDESDLHLLNTNQSKSTQLKTVSKMSDSHKEWVRQYEGGSNN